jgi:hypothetical protein
LAFCFYKYPNCVLFFVCLSCWSAWSLKISVKLRFNYNWELGGSFVNFDSLVSKSCVQLKSLVSYINHMGCCHL